MREGNLVILKQSVFNYSLFEEQLEINMDNLGNGLLFNFLFCQRNISLYSFHSHT